MGALSLVILYASNVPPHGIFGTTDAYIRIECNGIIRTTKPRKLDACITCFLLTS